MATVAHTRTAHDGNTFSHVWTPLVSGSLDGEAITHPGAADRSVQVLGTFDSTVVTLEGSNQAVPTVWKTLNDSAGGALSFTVAGLEAVNENTLWVRPLLTGGTAPSITVILLSRSTK